MITMRQENARTLAAVLGIGEDEAASLLDVSVLITTDSEDQAASVCAGEFEKLISRTITTTSRTVSKVRRGIEVVFGAAKPRTKTFTRVVINSGIISIGKSVPALRFDAPHRLALLMAACYACGSSLRLLLGDRLKLPLAPRVDAITIELTELFGPSDRWLYQTIYLEEAYLAGAGAIGNGLVYALSTISVVGKLSLLDPDVVSEGNLNRCVWFDNTDIGEFKTDRLVLKAQPHFPSLKLLSIPRTLQEVRGGEENWLRRLIVAVDSRRARRRLATELPGEVFDASTTDVSEIVLHYHRQPTDMACLGCIYDEAHNEEARDRHVAEMLGVDLTDVQKLIVDDLAASKILSRYPHIPIEAVRGKAFDSLFKALCSTAALRSPEQRQVFAPFGFISVLAGAYLAIELGRRLGGDTTDCSYNYWRVSPWSQPIPALKQQMERSKICDVCSKPQLQRLRTQIWERESWEAMPFQQSSVQTYLT